MFVFPLLSDTVIVVPKFEFSHSYVFRIPASSSVLRIKPQVSISEYLRVLKAKKPEVGLN